MPDSPKTYINEVSLRMEIYHRLGEAATFARDRRAARRNERSLRPAAAARHLALPPQPHPRVCLRQPLLLAQIQQPLVPRRTAEREKLIDKKNDLASEKSTISRRGSKSVTGSGSVTFTEEFSSLREGLYLFIFSESY